MDPNLVTLTAGALAGLYSRPNGGHGVAPVSDEELGRRAAAGARAALAALEDAATEPAPRRVGEEKATARKGKG